jgi:PhnB protein
VTIGVRGHAPRHHLNDRPTRQTIAGREPQRSVAIPRNTPRQETSDLMTAPTPYIHLPGTARDALTFYGDVFGCAVQLHTFEEFHRADGPANAIAHGYLMNGPVSLFAADVFGDEPPLRSEGMTLALLGTSTPAVLRNWFSSLSEGGRIVDDLHTRPWGATDGQVIDRYGLRWLIGFEGDEHA